MSNPFEHIARAAFAQNDPTLPPPDPGAELKVLGEWTWWWSLQNTKGVPHGEWLEYGFCRLLLQYARRVQGNLALLVGQYQAYVSEMEGVTTMAEAVRVSERIQTATQQLQQKEFAPLEEMKRMMEDYR